MSLHVVQDVGQREQISVARAIHENPITRPAPLVRDAPVLPARGLTLPANELPMYVFNVPPRGLSCEEALSILAIGAGVLSQSIRSLVHRLLS